MMLLGVALAPAPLLLWPWLYRRYRSVIEPPPVTPALPTPDLGDEPPAVVNLLVHQDPVTVDAAEATLLDLASRGIVELWAADGTGAHTVVRVRQSYPVGLTGYESLVLERDWQRGFPTFADLPPAAVAVWDRYLAYGAALDATPSTSGTIDLGYDWKKRLWSAYGGRWRRVSVRTKTWAAIRLALLRPRALIPEVVLGFVWSLVGPFFLVLFPFGS